MPFDFGEMRGRTDIDIAVKFSEMTHIPISVMTPETKARYLFARYELISFDAVMPDGCKWGSLIKKNMFMHVFSEDIFRYQIVEGIVQLHTAGILHDLIRANSDAIGKVIQVDRMRHAPLKMHDFISLDDRIQGLSITRKDVDTTAIT